MHNSISDDKLVKIIKAILLSANKYVSIVELASVFYIEDNIKQDDIKQALLKISKEGNSIYRLVERAGEYSFEINRELNLWVKRFKKEPSPKLPRALLETLGIIAYYQPISRSEISMIRGCDTHLTVYQELESRDWVRDVGKGGEYDRSIMYATTKKFLQDFGLDSISDLPNAELELGRAKLIYES